MFQLSKQKRDLLTATSHILAIGGPGSGKTTIALLKAKHIIEDEGIRTGQNILFLSFARATVARVEQQAGIIIPKSTFSCLEINTYHGFTWNLLKSHGRFINSKYPFHLLPPPEASAHFAGIETPEAREIEKQRLFKEKGILHFDLFARLCTELLTRSKALCNLICDKYPVIIVDEFQDTNKDEWNLIRQLGRKSRIIALADIDQRIYEFRGADPARVSEFIAEFKPAQFDFGSENNRSEGTDIVQFGNDLLAGTHKDKIYQNVKVYGYKFRKGDGSFLELKAAVLESRKRLVETKKDNWSLAVLVPTKSLMLAVSNYLGSKQTLNYNRVLPAINHEVALESAGPALSASVIAGLLENTEPNKEYSQKFILNLCDHIRGRKGDKPSSKKQLELTDALQNYLHVGTIKGSNRRFVVGECLSIVDKCRDIIFSGNPAQDWVLTRDILEKSECEEIKQVANDAQYLRLLRKGAKLNSRLGTLWRNNGTYVGASEAVKEALLQEHFSASTKVWTGIHVMTMHKAKGKEFDEVIIYEGYFNGKIIPINATSKEIEQARLKLRVAVTRAMKFVTIYTPANDVCKFFV